MQGNPIIFYSSQVPRLFHLIFGTITQEFIFFHQPSVEAFYYGYLVMKVLFIIASWIITFILFSRWANLQLNLIILIQYFNYRLSFTIFTIIQSKQNFNALLVYLLIVT